MNGITLSAWQPWKPTQSEPWNLQRVWHLQRRTGFGASWSELERDLYDGVDSSLDRVFRAKARSDGIPENFAEIAATIGQSAVSAGNPDRLKAWWVYRMLFSPDPLTERLTLMWHNHFATSNLKVANVALMWRQNELMRQHGRGQFGELLRSIVKDPAMLVWLDAEANRREHPNENLARELMELFTLGESNYTETDVREAAKCLTGWTVNRGEFRDRQDFHDDTEKNVLGSSGCFNGDDLLDLLLAKPATARRLAWRLCNTFLGETVASDAEIDDLGQGLYDRELDINWGVETILRSRLFFSLNNLRTRISSPAEFVVGTVRALELLKSPPSTLLLAETMSNLGQELFYPPNVFGWREGRSWINTRSLIGRANYSEAVVAGRMVASSQAIDVLPMVVRHGIKPDCKSIASFFAHLLVGSDLDESLHRQLADVCREPVTNESARSLVQILLASPTAQLC